MDRFTAMRVFARVVEAGTFTKAADSLEMPKPTVTKLVQGLEAHLRVKLPLAGPGAPEIVEAAT